MTEFVPQYYRMNPETEVLLYGWELMDGMEVLIEPAIYRADLSDVRVTFVGKRPDGAEARNFELTEHVKSEALRMNRWAKVTKFAVDSEYDKQIAHFVAEYEDGTQKVQSWDLYIGWLVKKDSIPEGFRSGVLNSTLNAEQTKTIVMNGEGIANEWCRRQGLKMVPIDDSGVAKWVEENLTDVTTVASLKTAGYSNVAIGQIMRLTEKRVREILDRHAETPFLKEKTNRNLLDDLESGRLRFEVSAEQDGRDVQAVIKQGPNYRPSKEVIFRQFMKENAQFFETQDPIKLPELAQKFNGEFCTSEDTSTSWQLNHKVIEELAQIYWAKYDFASQTLSGYMGFGLTTGQIMTGIQAFIDKQNK